MLSSTVIFLFLIETRISCFVYFCDIYFRSHHVCSITSPFLARLHCLDYRQLLALSLPHFITRLKSCKILQWIASMQQIFHFWSSQLRIFKQLPFHSLISSSLNLFMPYEPWKDLSNRSASSVNTAYKCPPGHNDGRCPTPDQELTPQATVMMSDPSFHLFFFSINWILNFIFKFSFFTLHMISIQRDFNYISRVLLQDRSASNNSSNTQSRTFQMQQFKSKSFHLDIHPIIEIQNSFIWISVRLLLKFKIVSSGYPSDWNSKSFHLDIHPIIIEIQNSFIWISIRLVLKFKIVSSGLSIV